MFRFVIIDFLNFVLFSFIYHMKVSFKQIATKKRMMIAPQFHQYLYKLTHRVKKCTTTSYFRGTVSDLSHHSFRGGRSG